MVVGAGIVGLACGWRTAQSGLSVLVIERDTPGAGASGVAAGMLAPVTEAEFGEQALLALNLEGAALWPRFDADLRAASGTETGYRESGALVVAADRDDAEELRRLNAFQRSLGLDAEWLTARECRRLEPGLSPRVSGAILARQDHQVDPGATIEALGRALTAAGGELATGVETATLEIHGDRVTGARLADGSTIRASHVVVAAGCWSAEGLGLPDGACPPVRPVKGQILSLRGQAHRLPSERLIRTPRCYVVPRESGELVVGATVEERGFDTRVSVDGVHGLLEAAREVLPDVAELEFVAARAGLRPGSPDNAPIVGAGVLDGLVWATGHYRNGVLLAPLTAESVTARLAGGHVPPAMAPFGPERFVHAPAAAPAHTAASAHTAARPLLGSSV